MKNAKITFLKGLGALAMVGLSVIVLGSFLFPVAKANAQVLPASVGITASPSNITAGQSARLTWTSTDATSISITGIGSVSPYGSQYVSPSQTTTYVITGTNTSGGYATATATVYVSSVQPPQTCQDPAAINYGGSLPCRYTQPPQLCQNPAATNYGGPLPCVFPPVQQPPTVSISANPSSVSMNGTSVVTWNSTNATSCTASSGANGWSGSKPISGTFYTGALNNTTTYNITCTNSVGSASDSTTVSVNNIIQNPTVNITANPTNVNQNGSSVVTWNSTNATSCSASGGSNGWSGSKPISGTFYTGALTNATTYFITCSNSTGSANDSVTVTVNGNNNSDVTVNIYADDTSIDEGDSTRVYWDSTNADYCTASGGTNGWSGSRNTSGSFYTGSLDSDETYRITCYNASDSATDSVLINVDSNNNNDDAPDVETRNATNVSTTSATLNGRVDGNGHSVRAWFEYGTTYSLGYTTSSSSYGSGSTNFSRSISGLAPNTTYYFRAVAENSIDTVYGNILSFRTDGNNIYIPPTNNQPSVVIFADSTNLSYNGATTIRWSSYNATSCVASGGSIGWAGNKSIGPASFYTGSLSSTRTYTITCTNNFGSSTDYVTVNVRGQVINNPVTPTSYVIINSSVDRNQPILPTLDNSRPHPGDEINYTVTYQNIGNASITNLVLRMDLPFEVDYMFSNPNNPTRNGNTLIFNLGTLKANGQGTVTVRVRVRESAAPGAFLNFPAVLSYTDPLGNTQSVSANVSAQVWSDPNTSKSLSNFLGANVFGAEFFPDNLFGWLLLLILILILVLLARYLYSGAQPFKKRTTTTTVQH
jgi:uncharacterized repeat protein (TIGR01451 family)